MARANVDAQPTNTTTPLNPTLTALGADGIAVIPDPDAELIVNNPSGAPIDLVVVSNLTRDGVELPDKSISIPATATRYLKMFTDDAWRQSDSRVWLDGDGLSVAVIT